MIINTGNRTDIPAFFSKWFCNRLREGFVCVRSPYAPEKITRYNLDPSVVDCITFCTKNPGPMLPQMQLLSQFNQYWFVTVTPYGKEIEPGVGDKLKILEDVKALSKIVGRQNVAWRYDPVSPLLVGNIGPQDTVEQAVQKSWKSKQLMLF